MNMIRPPGAGRQGSTEAFLRTIASPRAAIVVISDAVFPSDWPVAAGSAEDNLGHALGWTLEIRRQDIVLMNPLGEGIIKAELPTLSPGWLQNARHDGSCAVFLSNPADDAGYALLTIEAVARSGDGRAATVRTAVAADYGKVEPVGRNAQCPCGSGKKFKHCHG